MAYEITATRKRPHSFDELAGQEFVSATLRASIASGRIAHAYLFSGPRGCGKTSTARILARSLNCEGGPTAEPCGHCHSCEAISRGSSIDVIEIDGASNTSVENIRQIKDEVLFPPNSSKYKIYIIDEVHMLSNSAFNALLKTIEEPPPYIVFMFATTELHKVPATIKSRCQQFNFRLIPLDVIIERLRSAAADLKVQADDDALLWIAKEATGSLRDAYTLFDQVASFSAGHISSAVIRDKLGLVGQERMGALFALCFAGQRPQALDLLSTIIIGGVSVEQFVADAVSFMRALLLISCGVERETLLGATRTSFSDSVTSLEPAQIERILAGLFDLHRNLRFSVNPIFELELFVSRVCAIRDYVSPAMLARTVDGLRTMLVQGSGLGAAEVAALAAGLGVSAASSSSGSAALQPAANSQPEASAASVAGQKKNELTEAAGMAGSATSAGVAGMAAVPGSPVSDDDLLVDDEAALAGGNDSDNDAGAGAGAGAGSGESANSAAVDAQWLREKLITHLAKKKLVLSSSLERTSDWLVRGDRLELCCANSYDGNIILGESNLLSKRISELTGRVLRLDIKVPEAPVQAAPASASSSDDDDDDFDGFDDDQPDSGAAPADSATIVERVFRGKRISES